jgi:thiamine biosynthesis lipoprotein
MRIILDGSVSTVKRLRVSLGTLVAIEATADDSVAVGGIALAGARARRQVRANATRRRAALAEATAADVVATETRTAQAAIERAFEAIEQVNRLMHPRAEGSELARINSAPLHAPTKVDASIGQLLNLAKRIHTLTAGVFDPCTPAQPGGLGDVEVSDDETEVVCHAPVSLDFGGFAKGYAVDCAIEALVASGCTAGGVNAGGDMRVFGHRDEPVFVRGPAGELTANELVDAALAVSDAMSGQRPPEHQGYYVRGAAPTPATDQHAVSSEPTSANQRGGNRNPSAHGSGSSAHDSVPSEHGSGSSAHGGGPGARGGVSSELTAASSAVPAPTAATYAAVIADKAVIADALAKCVLLCAPAVTAHALRVFGATQLRSPVDIAATLTDTSPTR